MKPNAWYVTWITNGSPQFSHWFDAHEAAVNFAEDTAAQPCVSRVRIRHCFRDPSSRAGTVLHTEEIRAALVAA